MKRFVLAAIVALVGLLPSVYAATTERLATELFFKHPEFTDVTLSPDGEHMAVTVPQGDRTILAVMRTDDKSLVGKWDYGARRHILRVVWVNPERILMRVAIKVGTYDFLVGRGDIYASNIDGTQRIDIPNGDTYDIAGLIEDDPKSVYLQRSIDGAYLFKLDVYTGKIRTVATAPLDQGSFLIDHRGEVRYVVGRNKDLTAMTLRRDGKGWKEVRRWGLGEGYRYPLGFAADNKHVYMQVSDRGEPARIVRQNPETGDEQTVSSDELSDPRGHLWSSDGKELLGVRYEPHRPVYDLFNAEHPETKLYAGLIESFPDHAVQFAGASRDGRLILIRTYSDRDPGAYYLYDRDKREATFLLSNREWIDPSKMAKTRPVRIEARDGLVLPAYFTAPNGMAKNMPLVLLVHGGPHGPFDAWGFDPEVQFLANRGYAVLQVNFRGSGGYGTAFEAKGYQRWGREMQDDLTDAVHWAINLGIVDKDRVCIAGGSYGGYAALMSIVREPDLYRCSFGYIGVYSLPMMFTKGDVPETEEGRNTLKRYLPLDAVEQHWQSPAFHADKIKTPLMLAAGGMDVRAPKAHTELVIEEMKKVGKAPEEVIIEPKEAHGFYDVENNVKLYDTLERFLNRHIGPKTSD